MKNIQIVKGVIVASLLILFSGCAKNEQLIATQDGIKAKSQSDIRDENQKNWALALPKFSLENKDITNWLLIQDLNFDTRDDDLIFVQAIFKNNSSSTKNISYIIEWKDDNGLTFKTILSKWKDVEIFGGETMELRAISPSTKVKDFKIKIKEN